ncbi:DoxX family protein [Acidocella aromatica]|uniref:Putative oxidoreductase n=1 Tax=Acidocella aromatica TaxID=1303579 RepID=A0A840V8V2_9PROT|nr:DoxX family protein [Acidocella aromatica]MBB5372176.1 putative oxidoreductase [Acidocella aromatica]
MFKYGAEKFSDELILAARFLLVLLYLIFGWQKITDYAGTVAYMAQTGAPVPGISAVIAIIMELFVSAAIVLGVFTRPLALLLMAYTLGTGIIGHHYWNMTGMAQFENMINFYKNVSIMGGLLLLYVTGSGKYSIDRLLQYG